jgi:hypothetical protein
MVPVRRGITVSNGPLRRIMLSPLIALPLAIATAHAQSPALTPDTRLEVVGGRAEWTEHRGLRALHLLPLVGEEKLADKEIYAVVAGTAFHDGVIEVDVAGARRAGYATDDASAFKGFVGVSFRLRGDTAERFYLRTENSRHASQLFRNRTTQYEAGPDFPWQRLRRESPGKYESWVDVEPGAWTHLRIEVAGTHARLYVDHAVEPALVVDDLKLGDSRGAVALWTRISADAHFANLVVTPAASISRVLNGRSETVTWRGRGAVHLVPSPELAGKEGAVYAILDGPEFRDGTIEVDLAGVPRVDAPADSRGFVGVSFRTGPDAAWSEVVYLRPTNGRADDQVRRNRAVQYVSEPEFPWERLRQESPGVYESRADLEPGAWTRLRVEVAGTTARVFVGDGAEPVLVVNDLKGGARAGRVALWAHVQTDAYFGAVRVLPR